MKKKIPQKRTSRVKHSLIDRKYISFFSGALGLDVGFEEMGLRCLAANDVDRVACQTIKANRKDLPLYDCDIRALNSGSSKRTLDSKEKNSLRLSADHHARRFLQLGGLDLTMIAEMFFCISLN